MPSSKDAQPASVQDVLKKAEQRYKQAHPLASVGNDVSAVTRGELVAILEELVTTLAGGGEVRLEKDEKAIGGLLEGTRKLSQDVGNLVMGFSDLADRVAALEAKGAPKADKPAAKPADKPAAKPADKPAAKGASADDGGAASFLALGRATMEQWAADHGVALDVVHGASDEELSQFLAAAKEALGL